MAGGSSRDRRVEFQEVALPHLRALYNLGLSLTRDPAEAENLVQETYLKAYRFFDTYTPGTRIQAWLFRILRNTFINRYRARRARPEEVNLTDLEAGYEKMIDAEFLRGRQPPSPEEVLSAQEIDDEVRRALDALPEEYRMVVILALVEDLTYREISAALSIPLGTVMSRLHRGRRILQASLLDFVRRKGILRRSRIVPSRGESTS